MGLLKSTSALLNETLCGKEDGSHYHRLKCVSRECDDCEPEDLQMRLKCEVMATGKGSAAVSYWQWTSFKDAKGKTKVDKLKLSVPGFVFSKKRVNKNDIKWV